MRSQWPFSATLGFEELLNHSSELFRLLFFTKIRDSFCKKQLGPYIAQIRRDPHALDPFSAVFVIPISIISLKDFSFFHFACFWIFHRHERCENFLVVMPDGPVKAPFKISPLQYLSKTCFVYGKIFPVTQVFFFLAVPIGSSMIPLPALSNPLVSFPGF